MTPPEISAILPQRGFDKWGAGHWRAPRGERVHEGIDYACYPGTQIRTPVAGRVTKHGYPYANNLHYRYVQVTTRSFHHRFFYVYPAPLLDTDVIEGDIIGRAQDLTERYPGITNHVHYEVMTFGGERVNPGDPFGMEAQREREILGEPPELKEHIERHRHRIKRKKP